MGRASNTINAPKAHAQLFEDTLLFLCFCVPDFSKKVRSSESAVVDLRDILRNVLSQCIAISYAAIYCTRYG
jgi:hypothetical protein